MNKKLAPLRVKIDVTQNSVETEWTKSRFELAVTSYGCNKILEETKNQEKANNSPSYRSVAIKEKYEKSWDSNNSRNNSCNSPTIYPLKPHLTRGPERSPHPPQLSRR